MNYFMSDLRGAANAYFEMKDRISFKANDELFLLGDIFDGNNENPGACITILNDIITNDNIHLILGDHEYAHIMHYISKENPEAAYEWENYITDPSFGGTSFFKFFNQNLSKKEQEYYIAFLLSCELTELLKIGQRYFYVVHGSPAVCKQKDTCSWQRDVSSIGLSLQHNYAMAIASNPDLLMPKDMTEKNTFIIAGHIPTRFVFEENEKLLNKYYKDQQNSLSKKQKIIFENQKMMIDCGCSGNTIGLSSKEWTSNLACVAIDAAGFFIEYLL